MALLALCSGVSVVGAASGSAIFGAPLLWPLPQSYSHGTGSASLPAASTGFFGAPATPLLARRPRILSMKLDDDDGDDGDANAAASDSTPPLLWPLPQSYSHGSGVTSLPATPTGFFSAPDRSTPLLGRAFARYSKIAFRGCGSSTNTVASSATVSHLTFNIDMPDAEGPEEHMDEWYEMHVPVSGPALVHARTQWGALRALETFSQAVVNCTVVGLPLYVADAPRFTHRGLMLDLARMYWTMEGVHSVVDAMAYSKLNVLHLVRAAALHCSLISLLADFHRCRSISPTARPSRSRAPPSMRLLSPTSPRTAAARSLQTAATRRAEQETRTHSAAPTRRRSCAPSLRTRRTAACALCPSSVRTLTTATLCARTLYDCYST